MTDTRDEFVLHSYRWCPYAIRVRIVLALKKVPYTTVEEDLNNFSSFLVDNVPDPKVPVLVHNGFIIRESNLINEYLENYQPEPELVPFSRSHAEVMRDWWAWCDAELKPQIDIYKYEDDSRLTFKAKGEVERHLEYLQLSLKGKPFLLGDNMTLADIAIIPFIRQIQRVRRDAVNFRHFPKVKVWADQVLAKPYFEKEVMKK